MRGTRTAYVLAGEGGVIMGVVEDVNWMEVALNRVTRVL
jgi:hypothetical protein